MNVTKCWNNIAEFEEGEIKAWEKASPLQKEARAQARMAAYVALMEREMDKADRPEVFSRKKEAKIDGICKNCKSTELLQSEQDVMKFYLKHQGHTVNFKRRKNEGL